METTKDQLNARQIDDGIADLMPCRWFEAFGTCIRYCETNKDLMRCDLCRKRGLPIGSGVEESACKQIVGSRFKRAGCHWP